MQWASLLVAVLSLSEAGVAASPARRLWGSDGHKITAQVAMGLLSPAELAWTRRTLGGTSLANVATWADDVKFERAYSWSGELHFINARDKACTFHYDRDCVDSKGVHGNCVAGAILNYTQRLQASSDVATALTGDSLSARNQALRFLTHFMGDIHQPLHAGWTSDKGGNTIHVEEEFDHEKKLNLHQVWDEGIIEKIEKDKRYQWGGYAASLLKKVKGPWATKATSWARCLNAKQLHLKECLTQIAQESLALDCKQVYRDEHGKLIKENAELDEGYYELNSKAVDLRLAQGGVRLAALLKHIKGAEIATQPSIIV